MAALLPGKTLSVTEDMHVFVDEMPTRTTADREKILCASNPNSVAVQYGDIIGMKRAQRRELIQGKEVVYIYHNTIDAIGDKAPTEQKVFEACTDALEELAGLVRVIVNDMQGTDILITADHGFLYTYRPLTEGDKVGREVVTGTIYEIGRRSICCPYNGPACWRGSPSMGIPPETQHGSRSPVGERTTYMVA